MLEGDRVCIEAIHKAITKNLKIIEISFKDVNEI
jgi:hypothetical protein